MASQSQVVPAQAFRQSQARTSVHAPSLRAAFIAFVAIVILFRWMHLIVSLRVAATESQIQMSSDMLAEGDRTNAALLYSIAEATSPRSLAQRAVDLGYGPRAPDYVGSDQPIVPLEQGALGLPMAEEVLADLVTPAAAHAEFHSDR